MVNLFQAPIPGQSLTDTPRNAPWERPSEYNTVEDAVTHYIRTLSDDNTMDDIAMAFEMGADLKTMTEVLMLSGSMKGLHTVEVGMLAGPVVASYIKAAMQTYGVDTPETPISYEEVSTANEKRRLATVIEQAIEQAIADGAPEGDTGVAMLQEALAATEQEATPAEEQPMAQEEEAPKPSMGKGLMARGGSV